LFHLLLVIIVPGCLFAGWWQVRRAMSGNLLSYAYSVEWPIFAVIAVIGWWQLIHEDPVEVVARKVERARRAEFRRVAQSEDPSMWSIGLRRAGLDGALELDAASQRSIAAVAEGVGPGSLVAAQRGGDERPGTDELSGATMEAIAAYDLYLRRLAASNRPKTWRNPRGIAAPTAGAPGPQGSDDVVIEVQPREPGQGQLR
jgi:hypothetical protein